MKDISRNIIPLVTNISKQFLLLFISTDKYQTSPLKNFVQIFVKTRETFRWSYHFTDASSICLSSGQEWKMKKKGRKKKKNCLLKVLSIADRLIHSQINRPRTTRRATPSSFTLLFDHAPSFPHHRVLPCLPSLPPVSFSFAFLSGNKQLLSTFRPAKWEKATAVQLFASLTGFARISTTEM